jgi:hypothetical protein
MEGKQKEIGKGSKNKGIAPWLCCQSVYMYIIVVRMLNVVDNLNCGVELLCTDDTGELYFMVLIKLWGQINVMIRQWSLTLLYWWYCGVKLHGTDTLWSQTL